MLYRFRNPEAPWVSEGISARDWRARQHRQRLPRERARPAPRHYAPITDWIELREKEEQR
ncbi:MAG: hypothetical protein Q7P63_04555 [Verrucomicrobiota bacterium JB022]|nr:hypothetical protein [Verrucomicrobiota bacterium JB022]